MGYRAGPYSHFAIGCILTKPKIKMKTTCRLLCESPTVTNNYVTGSKNADTEKWACQKVSPCQRASNTVCSEACFLSGPEGTAVSNVVE